MIIDCSECEMQNTDACKDCLVMAVLSREEAKPLEITPDERAAFQELHAAGLAPVLKFKRRAG